MIAPICCAIGAVIPLWLVLMFAGWILFLGGNPYVRGVTWFAVFTLRYDSSELDTVLCGNTIDSESEDEGIVFDFEDEGSSSIMTPSPSPISSTGCEVVSEVQQWSWTKLKWTHLAWVRLVSENDNISFPSNTTTYYSRLDLEHLRKYFTRASCSSNTGTEQKRKRVLSFEFGLDKSLGIG